MGPGMGGMRQGERRAARQGDVPAVKKQKLSQSERLRELWPDIRELILPRRGIFALGFVLMVINRLCALVLPSSTKPLIDRVIGQRDVSLLGPVVGAVVAATIMQGVTSFALTQLLSKAGQRLIAELRVRVQQHVGRLPVSY